MTKAKKPPKPTWDQKLILWKLPDEAWARIKPILDELCLPAKTGRPRTIDFRDVLDAVIFRMRSGCRWNQLPEKSGDDSRMHHWLQKWTAPGAFERIWATILEECQEPGDVNWTWQAADGCMNKSRFGGEQNRAQPNRPGQIRNKKEPAGRGRRRSAGGGD